MQQAIRDDAWYQHMVSPCPGESTLQCCSQWACYHPCCTQHWWTNKEVSQDSFFNFSCQCILKRNEMRMEIWEFPGHMASAFLHLTSFSKSYLCRFWRLSIILWLGLIISGNPTTQGNALPIASSPCLKLSSSQSNYQVSWRIIMEMSFLDPLFIWAIPHFTSPRELTVEVWKREFTYSQFIHKYKRAL